MDQPEHGATPWRIRRTLSLVAAPAADALAALPGVLEFKPGPATCWSVVYDVREVQFATLVAVLAGVCPSSWFWRMRVRWYQFQDVNIRDSLLAKDGPCCNRPPRPR